MIFVHGIRVDLLHRSFLKSFYRREKSGITRVKKREREVSDLLLD